MSVWDDIDAYKARHEREFKRTREAVKQLGGAFVRIDDAGRWRCSFNLGAGERKHFDAATGEELVGRLADYLKPATSKRGAA